MKLSTGGNQWYPKDLCRLLALQSEVHPNRAALQPCLDGPELKSGQRCSGGFTDD